MQDNPQNSEKQRQPIGLATIAAWQFACFAILLLLIWANEVLDLPARVYGLDPSPPSYLAASLLSAFVIFTAILTVGYTYVKQQELLTGMVTVCSRCYKVRVRKDSWEAIEKYIAKRAPVDFSHGYCPDCFADEMAQLAAKKGAAAATD